MPMPKSVKLAGVELEEVHGVTVSIDTPVSDRGYYDGKTGGATVQLLRRAKNSPSSEMFKFATNDDGRLTYVDGTIVLQNSKHSETYTIEMKKAYIQSWEFHQPPEDADLYETIVIKVGELSLSGDGKSEKFVVEHWDRS